MRVAKDELALDKAIGQYFVVNARTREFLGAAEGTCCGPSQAILKQAPGAEIVDFLCAQGFRAARTEGAKS